MTCRARLARLLRRALAPLLVAPAMAFAEAAPCPPDPQPPTAQQMQAWASQARDRGALWRIRKDDRVSYLYGTVHLGRPEWLVPGPRVAAALRESEVIALELDPTDPATVQATQAFLARLPRPQLSDAQQRRLAAQRQQACQASEAFAETHPVMQLIVLQLLSGRAAGLHPGFAQEAMLAGFAQGTGRRVVALETAELQLRHAVPDDPQAQRELIDSSLALLESGRGVALSQRLARHWEHGEIEALGEYLSWCDCAPTERDREQLRQLNDGRNPGLAERIDALHREGRRLFVAVGALHMTGPAALPRLLADRGWQVERVRY